MNRDIQYQFSADMHTCTIILDGKTYHNLRVKMTNMRDWQDPQWLYQVAIPCKPPIMFAIDRYELAGRKHPEWTDLEAAYQENKGRDFDEEAPPKSAKKKKKTSLQQRLF